MSDAIFACPRCGEEFERVEDCRAHIRTCRGRPPRLHVVPTADRRWAVLEVR